MVGCRILEFLERIDFNVSMRRTRSTDVFRVPFHCTNYGQNEPLTRLVSNANLYGDSLDFFGTSVRSFKHMVRSIDIG